MSYVYRTCLALLVLFVLGAGAVSAQTVTGTVTDGSGAELPAGTVIEAFVDDTLCGVTALPQVGMSLFGTGEYYVIVQGPDGIPACSSDGEVTFRIDGEAAEQTAVNDLQGESHELNLSLPEPLAPRLRAVYDANRVHER